MGEGGPLAFKERLGQNIVVHHENISSPLLGHMSVIYPASLWLGKRGRRRVKKRQAQTAY